MQKFGYVRTSTDKQLTDRQVNALEEVCDFVYIEDGVSAVSKKRPVYENVLSRMKSGDTFVVLSFDRVFRSVVQALTELDRMHRNGFTLKSLTQNFDTKTLEGKLLFTIAIALGEWERETLSKRTRDGMEAARQRGVKLGRPKKGLEHLTKAAKHRETFSAELKLALNELEERT